MERDKMTSDSSRVRMYLGFAKSNIKLAMFERARNNIELAKTNGATIEEINELENEIEILETEKLLKQAQQYISWGQLAKAKQYMNEAKLSGVLTDQIFQTEKEIKFIEDAKNQIDLFENYILKRDIKGAFKIKTQLQEVMSQLHSSKSYNNLVWQMSELEKKLHNLFEAQTFFDIALEYLNKGLFEEALKHLNSARQHGLSYGLFSDVEYTIKGKQNISMAEVALTKRQFGDAKAYLTIAKNHNLPAEDIIKLQEKIDVARKSIDPINIDKNPIDTLDSFPGPSSYQHLTGNLADDKKSVTATLSAKSRNFEFKSANDGIQKDKLDNSIYKHITTEQRKDATSIEYSNEFHENMAHSTLNDACLIDIEDSWEMVEPEYQRPSPSPINIAYGNSINNKYGSINNVTSPESNVNQQTLMRSFEKFNVSEEKSDIEYRDSIPNKNVSDNIYNQEALLLSEAESDTSHDDMKSHNIPKHQTTEDKNKGLQNSISAKPPVPKKPVSAPLVCPKNNTEKVSNCKDVKTQINAKSIKSVPNITNPKTSAREKHNANNACTRASASIESKDVKTAHTQNDNSVPLTKKCELLIKKALKEGCIENAEKILQIAQKLYPEHDFAFLSLKIVEAKSKATESQTKEISSKPIQMNITETKPKVIEQNHGNTGYYTLFHGMPKTQDNDTLKKQDNDMKKTQDRERTRDKSVVRPKDDCKMSSNSHNNKENTVNNDIANREQADCCLKVAKTALEGKDVAKAEKLAIKADRMYPSEETKTLLAKILQIKSSVKDREVKTEITNYSTINREDPIEAQKCLDIAFNAFSKDNIEKCKRFLKKANTFDKSIDIDVYMTDLQQKKVKKELEIETEKARVKNEMQRSKNTDTGYVSKACNAIKNVFGMGSQQETKNEYGSYKDCLQNKPSSPETKKSCKNSSIEDSAATDCIQNKPSSPETKKRCENSSIGDSAARSQSGSNTHGDSASKTGNGKEAENEGKSENELKAKELENKAIACAESGDYEQALLLLETAKGLHDTKSLQDITVQVQEAAENKKTAATSNQNLAKENEAKGSADSSEDIEMGNHQNNSETSQGTDSYVRNKRDYFETLNSSKTENNSHEYQHSSKVSHRSLELLKLGKGRGRGGKNKEENPTHPYHLRQRPCQGIPLKEEARNLLEMGVKAYSLGQLKEAEAFVMKSNELDSTFQTRNLLSEIRVAKNWKGSWYCS